jgi:uncharacterized protein YjiS (DUF1127 family)
MNGTGNRPRPQQEDAMTMSATFAPSAQGFAATVSAHASRVAIGTMSAVRAYRNRLNAAGLASLDDRALADLGLTRSDVRDAFAEPLWRDPTSLLRGRVGERRRRR